MRDCIGEQYRGYLGGYWILDYSSFVFVLLQASGTRRQLHRGLLGLMGSHISTGKKFQTTEYNKHVCRELLVE